MRDATPPEALRRRPDVLVARHGLLASGAPVVFTSPHGRAARRAARAARDAALRAPSARVGWRAGGTLAWRAAGHAVERNRREDRLLTPFDDDFGSVMRVAGTRRDAAWRD